MQLRNKIAVRLSTAGMLLATIGAVSVLLWRTAGPVRAQAPANMDWPFYGNDSANTRYQNVDQINPKNVAQLQPAWVFHTKLIDKKASMEVSPIVVNETMFITDGHDEVFAVNAATGEQIWKYEPKDMPPLSQLALCCFRKNTDVAAGGGK